MVCAPGESNRGPAENIHQHACHVRYICKWLILASDDVITDMLLYKLKIRAAKMLPVGIPTERFITGPCTCPNQFGVWEIPATCDLL